MNQDCLIKIFKYLSFDDRINFEIVCKKWLMASKYGWSDIKKFDELHDKNIANIILPRCGKYLTHLNLSHARGSELFNILKNNCQNLTDLSIIISNWNDENCIDIFLNMTKLCSLCLITQTNISYNFIISLEKLGNCLKKLCISSDQLDDSLNMGMVLHSRWIRVFSKFKCLENLVISYCYLNKNMMKVICDIKTLSKLKLDYTKLACKRCLIPILKLKNIKELHLINTKWINDFIVRKISKNCKKLISLCISHDFVTDRGIKSLKKLNKLKNLKLLSSTRRSAITDNSIKYFYNLKKFHIKYSPFISDDSIIFIINNSPELEELTIYGASITSETIQHASNIIKNRTNNIALVIKVGLDGYPDYLVEPMLTVINTRFNNI